MNPLLLAIIFGVIVGVLSIFIPNVWPLMLVAFILSAINGAINEKNKNKDE